MHAEMMAVRGKLEEPGGSVDTVLFESDARVLRVLGQELQGFVVHPQQVMVQVGQEVHAVAAA